MNRSSLTFCVTLVTFYRMDLENDEVKSLEQSPSVVAQSDKWSYEPLQVVGAGAAP